MFDIELWERSTANIGSIPASVLNHYETNIMSLSQGCVTKAAKNSCTCAVLKMAQVCTTSNVVFGIKSMPELLTMNIRPAVNMANILNVFLRVSYR